VDKDTAEPAAPAHLPQAYWQFDNQRLCGSAAPSTGTPAVTVVGVNRKPGPITLASDKIGNLEQTGGATTRRAAGGDRAVGVDQRRRGDSATRAQVQLPRKIEKAKKK
jgi:hypothetical protein